MKRLMKKADTQMEFNPALYSDENGEMLKQEVVDFLEDSMERVGAESDLESYNDGSIDGGLQGKTIIKWSVIEAKYGALNDWDREVIYYRVQEIPELQEVFKSELQDEADFGFEVVGVDIDFEETQEGLLITYKADVSFDESTRRNQSLDY
ncbi:gp351 [Bacillus phage G]|uniref:Gp351 n=1 Tax=Bacillus phage G TaxID=2884420 RepID=G3MA92_9CAUD|nr:gp351 [Bacillus phage G]AEO93610.1 gp351 [Bacillus phage G]